MRILGDREPDFVHLMPDEAMTAETDASRNTTYKVCPRHIAESLDLNIVRRT